MSKAFVDNDLYVGRRTSNMRPFDIPIKAERPYAQQGLTDLLALLYECPLGAHVHKRVLNRFARTSIDLTIKYIDGKGYLPFLKDMKNIAHLFLKSFKFKEDGTLYMEWNDVFSFSPIYHTIRVCERIASAQSDGFFKLVTWVHDWHAFLGKIPLTRPDLEADTIAKWIDIQLHGVKDIHQMPIDYVDALRIIVAWLFDEPLPQNELLGKHGPGSTNIGAKTIPDKEDNRVPTLQAELVCPTDPSILIDEPEHALYAAVPKDNGAMRSITQESIEMMRGQQSVKRKLYEHTDFGHVNLSHFVKFSDQTASRDAALRASKFCSGWHRMTTADLSYASDLVSSDLVCHVFSGDLNWMLMILRTWFIDIDDQGNFIEPRMYAGMGAATTFPVQTIIFTAISILALIIEYRLETYGGIESDLDDRGGKFGLVVRELLAEPRTKANLKYGFWSHLKRIRTYGDDIIVQDKALGRLENILTSLGLRLNVQKTFGGNDAVRESCGIFALSGRDITPLRFRIPVHSMNEPVDSAIIDAYRMFANRSYIHGYRRFSRRLVRRLEALIPHISTRSLNKTWSKVNGHEERMLKCNDGTYEFRARNTEYVRNFPYQVLYEEFRGDQANYLGVISSKQNILHSGIIFGVPQTYVCALMGKVSTWKDREHDRYHLEQYLYERENSSDALEEAILHGSVPDGTRLEVRIALRIDSEEQTWAWVPAMIG